jgi:hypothetical protein
MAKKKPVPRNRGMKPNLAVADTSGSNLADFKNAVSKAAKVVGAGNKALSNFTNELTGAGAIERAIDNPSKKSITSAAVGVGAAALPFIKLGKAASNVGSLYSKVTRVVPDEMLRLKNAGNVKGSGNVSRIIPDEMLRLKNASNVSQKVTRIIPDEMLRLKNASNVSQAALSRAKSAGVVQGLAVGPVVNALNNTLNPQKTKNKNKNKK